VLLFQQSGGLNQAEAEAGLEMNLDFFLGILNAMNIGDIINDVAYQIRPYEVNPGETDRVLDECIDMYRYGHRKGAVEVAANFALHAAERMKAERRMAVAV